MTPSDAHALGAFILGTVLVLSWVAAGALALVTIETSRQEYPWITYGRVLLWFAIPISAVLIYLWTR
jgi:hypothetical protein